MVELETNSDLVVGQWSDSPRLRSAIDAPLDAAREDVFPAFEQLEIFRHIDTAEGVWLDYLGVRVGLRRSATTDPSADERFGFTGPTQARGFDQSPFSGDDVNDAVFPLPDEVYRRFIRARATLVLGDGTFSTFQKAVRQVDPSARAVDNRDMSVTVYTGEETFIRLADTSGALPRTAGVKIIYLAREAFGFDDSGVGFDLGPFRV